MEKFKLIYQAVPPPFLFESSTDLFSGRTCAPTRVNERRRTSSVSKTIRKSLDATQNQNHFLNRLPSLRVGALASVEHSPKLWQQPVRALSLLQDVKMF